MRLRPAAFALLVCSIFSANAADRRVDIGGRKLFLQCSDKVKTGPTVILIAGGGGTTEAWSRVQPAVSKFARVCSYDYAGLGHSDAIKGRQTALGFVTDLRALLQAADLPKPYVLAGHSFGGLYARMLSAQIPNDIAGMVLIDSSHEEQIWRMAKASTTLQEREWGPNWNKPEIMKHLGFYPPGEQSTWHLDVPLIVIEHGRNLPNPFAPRPGNVIDHKEFRRIEDAWHELQVDLAGRSKFGELREAAHSDHPVPFQQPKIIVEAIRDVLARIADKH
ncbi:MAG: alpha/beta hydrolase family protein [Bryobacteraceae bacterium]